MASRQSSPGAGGEEDIALIAVINCTPPPHTHRHRLIAKATPNETVVSRPTRASCFSYLIDSHYDTSAYNLLESLTGNYSLIWSGLMYCTQLPPLQVDRPGRGQKLQ